MRLRRLRLDTLLLLMVVVMVLLLLLLLLLRLLLLLLQLLLLLLVVMVLLLRLLLGLLLLLLLELLGLAAAPQGVAHAAATGCTQASSRGARSSAYARAAHQFGAVGGGLAVRLGEIGRIRGHLRQTLDLEHLGGLEDVRQLLLRHIDLAVVHKVHHGLEVIVLHVLQDYNGMLARICGKQSLGVKKMV